MLRAMAIDLYYCCHVPYPSSGALGIPDLYLSYSDNNIIAQHIASYK